MNETEYLFTNTLDELSKRIANGSKYDLIKASGLLRSLLIDGNNSLIHQVNRNYREKIFFTVKTWQPTTPAIGKLELQTVMPIEKCAVIDIKLDTFLKTNCIFLHQNVYTVKEIIKIVANIHGGVHAGQPKTDSEKAISSSQFTDVKASIAGSESVDFCIGQIKAISIVTLDSLSQLKKIVNDIDA